MNPSRRERPTSSRITRVVALGAALAVVLAACGSSRKSESGGGTTTPGATTPVIDTSQCPAGQDTVGVSGNTITIGTSLPESGLYAAFTAILKGEKAYFDSINAQGGVTVAGKQYKINLIDKDDAYDAARTVQNVTSLINNSHVFSLFNVVGTKNNLAIRDTVDTQCVPNLLIASGAVQWGNTKFPWMLGSELVPYPLEMQTLVDYLKQNKPNATIAVLKANDDFGQSYSDTLNTIVQGTNLKVVQTQGYDPETSSVNSQVTSLAATHADVFVIGGTLLACPNALNAMGAAGWHPIVYMSGTCVSKVLLSLAGKNADGVLTVTPLLDPANPANDSSAAMQTYKTEVKKYEPSADATDGIVAYGWTTAALFDKILQASPKLTRTSVMETARNLTASNVALQIPGATWITNANDWFLGETYQLVKYSVAAGHTENIGPLTDLNGKTAGLSPKVLLTQ